MCRYIAWYFFDMGVNESQRYIANIENYMQWMFSSLLSSKESIPLSKKTFQAYCPLVIYSYIKILQNQRIFKYISDKLVFVLAIHKKYEYKNVVMVFFWDVFYAVLLVLAGCLVSKLNMVK